MNLLGKLRKMMVVLAVMFCLSGITAPAMTVYAASATEETQAVSETAAQETEDDGSFFLIMGGGLFIILFAVIAAVTSVSAAVAVAGNMDVDGE